VAAASTPAATAVELPVLRPGPAPTIRGATGFIGIDRLTDADLVGKVVLYDFWTFECINCQHTLSHLLAWQARYAPDGLLIVGIHTPEFAAEADPANVRRYVGEQRITWPVVLDADHHVWDAWDNGYWPEFYLHDELGRRRLVHIGEGAYDEVEDAIRALLHVDPASPRAVVTS
jgi:thiol-disulfide isomerase/thioredoxin